VLRRACDVPRGQRPISTNAAAPSAARSSFTRPRVTGITAVGPPAHLSWDSGTALSRSARGEGISRIGPSANSPGLWLVYAALSRDTHGMQRRSGSPGGTISSGDKAWPGKLLGGPRRRPARPNRNSIQFPKAPPRPGFRRRWCVNEGTGQPHMLMPSRGRAERRGWRDPRWIGEILPAGRSVEEVSCS
jgi:hypothetical protein